MEPQECSVTVIKFTIIKTQIWSPKVTTILSLCLTLVLILLFSISVIEFDVSNVAATDNDKSLKKFVSFLNYVHCILCFSKTIKLSSSSVIDPFILRLIVLI